MGISRLNFIAEMTDWGDDPGKDLIDESYWECIADMASLSERELQVSRLIFEGNTREQVGERLEISTRTVRHYMESLHEKLRVANRVGLVLRLVQIRDYVQSRPA
jgi:DNA-binding CsgD family transcriptional regulator